MSESDLPPVLIVGAGPTGMTAALDLAHYGIPSIVLDEDHKLSDGSRAIAFHHTALAVWEKLGAGKAILEKAVPWTTRHTYFKEKELYTQVFTKPAEGLLPRFVNIQQFYVEQFLVDQIQVNKLIDLRWDHRVTGLQQDDSAVTLDVEAPAGPTQLRGQYALACDGARSTMRRLLGLDFPGKTHNDRFLIADIRVDLNSPPEPRFYFDHPTNPGYTVLIHPQPDGVWRIDWQIGPGVDVERERSPEQMDERIRSVIGDLPYEIVWLSDYRFHQRLLAQFRHGRVFFAGDAAHLVAPFGARGMNSAIQDVENLGWKLAFVLKGYAPDSLLDTYQLERWPAQRENQKVTDRTMRFMSPPNLGRRLMRNAILQLSAFLPPARKWVDSGKMSEPFVYRRTPLVIPDNEPASAWTGAPGLGAQLPDVPLVLRQDGREQRTYLRKLLGSGFVVLHFVENGQEEWELARSLAQENPCIPLAVYPVSAYRLDDGDFIHDAEGSLSRLLNARPGTLLIVRPDRHLAARRHNARSESVSGLIRTLLDPNAARGVVGKVSQDR
jgi:2-polyprenyl-6-methoxyphenol hydroxylase-like FAD-dependent oxidoreductase